MSFLVRLLLMALPLIVTPFDNIPDPTGYGVTKHSNVATGNWSANGTWLEGARPVAGDVVSILNGHTITYDISNLDISATANIKAICIQSGGTLIWSTTASTKLTVTTLFNKEGGQLTIGSVMTPIGAAFTAEIVIADVALDGGLGTTNDPEFYLNGIVSMGNTTIHGAMKTSGPVRIANGQAGRNYVTAGDTVINVVVGPTGWRVGDLLVIPDTRQLRGNEHNGGPPTNYVSQHELPTIGASGVSGTTVNLTSALANNHNGIADGVGVVVRQPHIGNLTRNVIIRSAATNATVRGHVLLTRRSTNGSVAQPNHDIRYASFVDLGRTVVFDSGGNILPVDSSVVVSGNCTHVGSNQIGRYALHIHRCPGPAAIPANGYQWTFIGNSIYDQDTALSRFKWGITIHDSHYGKCDSNVIYNKCGSGVFTELGNESFNLITNNFVVRTGGFGVRADTTDPGITGDGYWFAGGNNYVTNNVAAQSGDMIGSTQPFSHGFSLYFFAAGQGHQSAGSQNIPSAQGNDNTIPAQTTTYDAVTGLPGPSPILQFQGNESYGATPYGMEWWGVNADDGANYGGGVSTIKDHTVWAIFSSGVFCYESYKLTIDNLRVYGDFTAASGDWPPQGFYPADYNCSNLILQNCIFEGVNHGVEVPTEVRDSSTQFVLKKCAFRCILNIFNGTPWTSSSNATFIPQRSTLIDTCVHDHTNVPVANFDIEMGYTETPIRNLQVIDAVTVINHKRNDPTLTPSVTNDNFTVYYTQQKAATLMALSTWQDSTTVAAGSNNVNLPTGTINVAAASAFPPNGVIFVRLQNGLLQTIDYTGTTGTSFTGCTGGSGTMHTGDTVSGVPQLYASPAASQISNQANFTQFGVATAGAVAPANWTTRAGIDGIIVASGVVLPPPTPNSSFMMMS